MSLSLYKMCPITRREIHIFPYVEGGCFVAFMHNGDNSKKDPFQDTVTRFLTVDNTVEFMPKLHIFVSRDAAEFAVDLFLATEKNDTVKTCPKTGYRICVHCESLQGSRYTVMFFDPQCNVCRGFLDRNLTISRQECYFSSEWDANRYVEDYLEKDGPKLYIYRTTTSKFVVCQRSENGEPPMRFLHNDYTLRGEIFQFASRDEAQKAIDDYRAQLAKLQFHDFKFNSEYEVLVINEGAKEPTVTLYKKCPKTKREISVNQSYQRNGYVVCFSMEGSNQFLHPDLSLGFPHVFNTKEEGEQAVKDYLHQFEQLKRLHYADCPQTGHAIIIILSQHLAGQKYFVSMEKDHLTKNWLMPDGTLEPNSNKYDASLYAFPDQQAAIRAIDKYLFHCGTAATGNANDFDTHPSDSREKTMIQVNAFAIDKERLRFAFRCPHCDKTHKCAFKLTGREDWDEIPESVRRNCPKTGEDVRIVVRQSKGRSIVPFSDIDPLPQLDCKECYGSGEYVGFGTIEPCSTCLKK